MLSSAPKFTVKKQAAMWKRMKPLDMGILMKYWLIIERMNNSQRKMTDLNKAFYDVWCYNKQTREGMRHKNW